MRRDVTLDRTELTCFSLQIIPRPNYQDYTTYGLADRIQSYCDHNDIACDSGDSSDIHHSYVQKHTRQAAKFVVEKACEHCVGKRGLLGLVGACGWCVGAYLQFGLPITSLL